MSNNNTKKHDEDFERQNADLIKRLRALRQEELSPGFALKLQEEVDKRPISTLPRPPVPLWQQIVKFFSLGEVRRTPFLYLSYGAAFAVLIYVGVSMIVPNGPAPQSLSASHEGRVVVQETPATRKPESHMEPKTNIDRAQRVDDEATVRIVREKVLKNLNYGFVQLPSRQDIKTILRSSEFRTRIDRFKKPVLNDSVRVVIEIVEERL